MIVVNITTITTIGIRLLSMMFSRIPMVATIRTTSPLGTIPKPSLTLSGRDNPPKTPPIPAPIILKERRPE